MPSSIGGGGIGVFAIKDIAKDTAVFRYNTEPNREMINISKSDVESLPPHARKLVEDFIIPNNDGIYPIPRSGLISRLGIDMYTNSCQGTEFEANVCFGDVTDSSGYVEVISTKDIKSGDELLLPYEIENCIRGKMHVTTENGKETTRITPDSIVSGSECRVCNERLDKIDPRDLVNIGCTCAEHSILCRTCAHQWFGKHIIIELKQHRPDNVTHDDTVDEWLPGVSAQCEICKSRLSSAYSKQLLSELASSETTSKAVEKLADKVNSVTPTPVSVRISEVPGIRQVPIYTTGKGKQRSVVGFRSIRERICGLSLGRRSRKNKKRRSQHSEGNANSCTTFENGTKALFWVKKNTNEKGRWLSGLIHEFVSAEERNSGCCSDAVCTCPKHSRGMYRYTIDAIDDNISVASYFSEYDNTVKVNGLSGKELWRC